MEEKEKIEILNNISDMLVDIKEDQYSFEASELGAHAQSESFFENNLLNAINIIDEFIFDENQEYNEDEILNILKIQKDENNNYYVEDMALEEYESYFKYNIDISILKNKLSKYDNYQYYDDEYNNIYLNFKDDLYLIDIEKKVKNKKEYLNIFLDKIKDLIVSKYDFNKEYIDILLNKYKEKDNMDFYAQLISDLKIVKSVEKINIDNNRLINILKGDNIKKDIYLLSKELFVLSKFKYVNEKIIKHFNFDTLNKNKLYKKLKEMVLNELAEREGFKIENSKFIYQKDIYISFLNNYFIKQVDKIGEKITENYLESSTIEIYEKFLDVFNVYNRYKNLIKNNKNFEIEKIENLENLYDEINNMVEESNLNKFVKKIIGSYHNLKTKENIDLLRIIKNKKIDENFIKKELKNIALIKSANELTNELNKIIKITTENLDNVLSLEYRINYNNLNAKIIEKFNNKKVLLITEDIEASKFLCPSSWCITKSNHFFNNYKSDGFNMVLFDFSRNDSYSIVGISMTKSGKFSIFDKNNNSIVSLDKFMTNEEISKLKNKFNIQCLKKEEKEFLNGSIKLTEISDPIYILSKININDIKINNFNILIEKSLKNSKFKKEETILRIIELNKYIKFDLNSHKLFLKEVEKIDNEKIKFLISKNINIDFKKNKSYKIV